MAVSGPPLRLRIEAALTGATIDAPVDRRDLRDALSITERQLTAGLRRLGDNVKRTEDGGLYLVGEIPVAPKPSPEVAPVRDRGRAKSSAEVKRESEALAERAAARPDVKEVRRQYLDGSPMARAQVPGWIEAASAKGEREECVTTGPAGTKKEHPAVQYAGPDDTWVRSIHSTDYLKPLRLLSERLARDYGWREAAAINFVLADVAPLALPRRTVTQKFDAEGRAHPKVSYENVDLLEDPHALKEAHQRVRRDLGFTGRRKTEAVARRQAALLNFVARHGTGEAARRKWNERYRADQPGWASGDLKDWKTAIKRARATA